MSVGSSYPVTGGGVPDCVETGVDVGVADSVPTGMNAVVGVGVRVASGARVADGVASPSTCVPLFRTVNSFVIATGLPDASTVDRVAVCFPIFSCLDGV